MADLREAYQSVLAENLKKGLRGTQDIYAGRGTTGGGSEALAMGEMGRQYGLGTAQNEQAYQQFGEGQRQFDVNQALAQQQFGLQSELGRGQLGLQTELGRGGLGLQQQQLAQQGSQFGQSLAQQGGQFSQSLAEQMASRVGSQGLQQQQLTQQGQQFGQSLAEQQAARAQAAGQFGQQFGEQQRQFNTGQGNFQQQFGLAQQAQNFGQGITQAGLTGQYQGQQTLQGQQFDLQKQQVEAGLAEGQNLDELAKQMGYPNAEVMTWSLGIDPDKAMRWQNKLYPDYSQRGYPGTQNIKTWGDEMDEHVNSFRR